MVTEPALLAPYVKSRRSANAPTTAVLPSADKATAPPNQSDLIPGSCGSGLERACCRVQVVPLRTNTFATPGSNRPALVRPTIAVLPSPDNATPAPSMASCSGSESVRRCCSEYSAAATPSINSVDVTTMSTATTHRHRAPTPGRRTRPTFTTSRLRRSAVQARTGEDRFGG